MIKIIGCVLLVAVSTSFSLVYISGLRKRITGIQYFLNLLEGLKVKMQYELCTVPQFIKSLEKENDKDFAYICAENLDFGYDLKTSWKNAVEKIALGYCLAPDDIQIIKSFANELGQTDLSGQISNISLHIQQLNKNISQAEDIFKDRSRVALNTGVFAGLIVSILLI